MPELRIDPLTGLRTIVASARATRPGGGFTVEPAPPIDIASDPFAEGHEDRTPPELFAVRPRGGAPNTPGWTVRVVPNLYPALSSRDPALASDGASPAPDADPELFHALPAHGHHEVIINGPQPVSCLASLPAAQLAAAMEIWRARIAAHGDAAYVHLSVNEGREGGASLSHSHAQLYALDFVPAALARERERFTAYAHRTGGANLLADLLQEEVRLNQRVVAHDHEAVALCPYGARLPYQLMVVPRRARERFEDAGPTGAALLHDVLNRLARRLGASPPLNLWVRTAPRDADSFCWRIDILPRLVQLAGLELGVGVHLNVVAPEIAAAELRSA